MANIKLIHGTTFKNDASEAVFIRDAVMTVDDGLAEDLMKTGRFARIDDQGTPLSEKIMVVDLTLGEHEIRAADDQDAARAALEAQDTTENRAAANAAMDRAAD